MIKPRILLCANYSLIEPLGLLYLSGLAKQEQFDCRFHLVKNNDFDPFFYDIDDFSPNFVGFNVYTGNHKEVFRAFRRLKRTHPTMATIIGGPHATYFPVEAARHSDFVVMGEGFSPLRRILRGEVPPGIITPGPSEQFPHPDRRNFYQQYPEHARSRIKSVISMTGCPYTCTYCYNSSTPADIQENLTPEIASRLATFLKTNGRLFPNNVRPVDSVMKEAQEISENWPTEVIYFQDDVFGFDTKQGGFLSEMVKRWPSEVGIPYHAQMRWEMTKQEKRLDLIQESGGFGLTLAIESSIPEVRRNILSRPMDDELIFSGMKNLMNRGMKIRTEQITGLPYGATPIPTLINLDADLHLLKFNVELKRVTKGPTMSWASTLAPYVGTKLANYCYQYGHYYFDPSSDGNDVPDTFFERSVLRFPKEWIGPSLEEKKQNSSVWLDEKELEVYRDQNAELRRYFNFFANIPEGHQLARRYLSSGKPFSYKRLGQMTKSHLEALAREGVTMAESILHRQDEILDQINTADTGLEGSDLKSKMQSLSHYFASLPNESSATQRTIDYAWRYGSGRLTPKVLSDATRHSLYEDILYKLSD